MKAKKWLMYSSILIWLFLWDYMDKPKNMYYFIFYVPLAIAGTALILFLFEKVEKKQVNRK
jgi:hypothetical protein